MKENLVDKLHEDDPKLKSFLDNAESIIKRDMEHFKETNL